MLIAAIQTSCCVYQKKAPNSKVRFIVVMMMIAIIYRYTGFNHGLLVNEAIYRKGVSSTHTLKFEVLSDLQQDSTKITIKCDKLTITYYRLASVSFGFVCFQTNFQFEPWYHDNRFRDNTVKVQVKISLDVNEFQPYTCRAIKNHPISEWPLNFIIQWPTSSYGWRNHITF